MMLSKLLVDIPNPFGDGMVRNPWKFDSDRTPDIESIHATAFGSCVRLLMQDVRRNGQSSLLIAGPAGSGKTNLVARLLRRLHVSDPPGLLCYVTLDDVAPQMLWSHLRQRVAGDLIACPDAKGKTGLERLLEYHLPGLLTSTAPRGSGSLLDVLSRCFPGPARTKISARIRLELFGKIRLDMEFRTALLKLFGEDAEKAELARDWLIGGRLTDEQLAQLGLPQGNLSDQDREHQSSQVVLSLLKLATDSLPIILCFDQVENLLHTLQDRSGFARLGQVVATLRNESGKGLFVVSFIRSDKTHLLKDAAGEANWARIAENRIALSPLTWPEANQLILQRMNAVPSLKLLRQSQPEDVYWPMDKQRLLAIHQRLKLTCTPRELLWGCKEAWGGDPPPPPPNAYLLSKWQQRCQQQKNASGGDRLLHALNGVPWLANLLGVGYEKIDLEDLRNGVADANLFLQMANGGRIALSACARTPQLWRRFDRLNRDWKTLSRKLNCRRLLLVCDTPLEELPVGTRARLQTLNQLAGVSSVCPCDEQMIALDALHFLLTEAHKGELMYDGRAMPAEDVDCWARESITAPGHELGMLRLLFDDLGLDLPTASAPASAPLPTGKPVLARKV